MSLKSVREDRDREPPLEAERDVERDQQERDEDREDRAAGDLAAEARRHVLDAERLAPQILRSGASRAGPAREVSDFVRIWKLLYTVAAGRRAASLDDRVAAADLAHLVAHLRRVTVAVGRLERDLRAALEVDAEVQALDPDRDECGATISTVAIESRAGGARAVDVDPLPVRDRLPVAPMKRGLSNQRKPASRPSIARVAATAVTSEITVPSSSISAKPFTCAVPAANRTNAVMQVTTFASTIVWKPLLVAAAIALDRCRPDAPLP